MRSRLPHYLSMGAVCTLMLICAPLATMSCRSMTVRHGHDMHGTQKRSGPPPHAPAHGHRHKHQRDDVELVFDSERGVYLVIGVPGSYFFDGVYYRRTSQQWQTAFTIEGSWDSIAQDKIPPGLRSDVTHDHSSSVHPGKGKGKGHEKKQSKDD